MTMHCSRTNELVMIHVPVLATCRGHKTVMRFFPNQAGDLEPVLALLARLDAEVRETRVGHGVGCYHQLIGFLIKYY